MSPFFPPPHDLSFFLQGFVSLLTALFLFWNLARFRNREQGQYFISFLALAALHAWLHMVLLGWSPGTPFLAFLVFTQSAAHACLAMAGYRAFVPATAPRSVRYLPAIFYLLLLAVLFFGTKTYFMVTHLLGGAVALSLGLAGLLRYDALRDQRRGLQRAAFVLLGLPLVFNAVAPFPILGHAWGAGVHRYLSSVHLIPEFIELAALVAGMFLLHLAAQPRGDLQSAVSLSQGMRRHVRVAMLAIAGIITTCWFFMGQAQVRKDAEERGRILQAIRNGSLAFSAREIALLSGSAADLNHLTYLRLKGQLQDLRRANPGSRFLYLMGSRDGRIFFFADSEPAGSPEASPPGQVYEEATETLRAVFEQGVEATEGPLPDQWGIWVSGLVPISEGHGVTAVLGMDVDASAWQRMLFQARFPALTVMWLGCLLILGVFVYMRKTGQSAQSLSESENKYRLLFEESADAYFLMKDTYTDCNEAACRLLGRTKAEIVGHTPWEFSPEIQKDGLDSRKLALDHLTRAREGSPQAFSWDHRTATGEILHTEVHLAKLSVAGESTLQIIVRDRTEELRRRELEH
ncbi:MAG: hypothetical protein C0405_08645, partial [Desulfovibrio sp.]|nr:hypothetical protein [Desulfovibrio sp.]